MGFLLLGTKTYLPRPLPGWVQRPRLLETLDQAVKNGRRVVLLSSAAGSGKSALISTWTVQAQARVAWLGLDANDDDPAIFWAYWIAALQKCFPKFAGAIQAELLSPQPPPADAVIPELLNLLAELPSQSGQPVPTIMVLDDFHLITQPAIHTGLIFMVEHALPGFTLILSTRVDPPMPLSRWRARAYLSEIRADDLRFHAGETAQFLNGFMGLHLDEPDLNQLEARTEGWAAGLQLAALSMQSKNDPKAFIAKFSASHQYILDYLTDEVLAQQPVEIQNFLVYTSILKPLNALLIDFILESHNSAEILSTLYQQNLFLISLDDERRNYRYHHLFAELLQIRFAQLAKNTASALHLKAAQWYDAQGNVDEAINHALAAGDIAYAADIVNRSWVKAAFDGYFKTAQKWLETLPKEWLIHDPALNAGMGWVLALTGKTQAAAVYVDQAERAQGERGSGDPGTISLIAGLRSLLALRAGDIPLVIESAQKAIQMAPPQDLFASGNASLSLAAGYRHSGQIEAAVEVLSRLVQRAKPGGYKMLANWSTYYLGRLLVVQGKLREASVLLETTLSEAREQTVTPALDALLVGLSEVRYAQNRLEEAEELIRLSQEYNRRGGSTDLLRNGLALKAQILQARQDGNAALALIAGDLGAISRSDPFFNAFTLAIQACIQARNRQFEPARQWVDGIDTQFAGHPGFGQMTILLYVARVYLALQRAGQARDLLARLSAAAEISHSQGWLLEISILEAIALAQDGEAGLAEQALLKSVAMAAPEGYLRIFIDAGEPVIDLIEKALTKIGEGPEKDNLEQLIAAFHPVEQDEPAYAVSTPVRPSTGLVETLSLREIEVLRLLADGLPNHEIAGRLFISLATVKTHLIHIFGKLGVQNRVEAVNQARRLNLI